MPDLVPTDPTPQALANSLFTNEPATPNTPSGGVSPAPAQVPSAPAGTGVTPPQQPAQFQQPAQQLAQPAPAAQPAQPQQPAQPPTPPVAPGRSFVDSLVARGQLTAEEARLYPSDDALFYDLLSIANQKVQDPGPPAAPTPEPPAPPTAETPPPDNVEALAMPLLQNGLLKLENGRYMTELPELQQVAQKLNQDRLVAEQKIHELRDPEAFMRKYGKGLIEEATKPLQSELQSLREQLAKATPAPHEAWINQHKTQLYKLDASGNPTQELSPVGQVYHEVYSSAKDAGTKDLKILHTVASRAAEAVMNAQNQGTAQPQPPAEPEPSFWQQAQNAPAASPGFTAPGSQLAQGQPSQNVPVDNRGFVDMNALYQQAVNGSLQL
jgi:polyhydroxyalkanoate synthesis regulator phasin